MRIASGFMAAKHLFAASELGIFEALADSPTTLDGLAARTGLTPRAARISADAMVALGLLEREGDTYRNGPVAGAFLTGRTGADLRPLLRHWDRVSFPAWLHFAESLAKGPREELFGLDDELQEIMAAGIESHNAGAAAALAGAYDFSRHRRLLDIGGGTGTWSIGVTRRYPQITATVLEIPAVAEVARKRVAEEGITARVDVVVGDALTDPVPTGYDVFLVANVVHCWSPEQNRAMLRGVRETAGENARLLLADFWTNATHTEPLAAALMAGEFAAHLRTGDVYSVEEIGTWLRETGWRLVEHLPLVGPQSLVVAEAA